MSRSQTNCTGSYQIPSPSPSPLAMATWIATHSYIPRATSTLTFLHRKTVSTRLTFCQCSFSPPQHHIHKFTPPRAKRKGSANKTTTPSHDPRCQAKNSSSNTAAIRLQNMSDIPSFHDKSQLHAVMANNLPRDIQRCDGLLIKSTSQRSPEKAINARLKT